MEPDHFQSLGEDINEAWRARHFREEAFPEIAAAALRKHDLASHVTPRRILDALLATHDLPRQAPATADFAVTLFYNDRFSVDVLFSVDSQTTVHDHPSWAALQVLSGSSLQTIYTFTETERLTSYLELGELRVNQLEALRQGDVREIGLGRDYIHAVCHLERPSVSLLASTRTPRHYAAPMRYLEPGLAYASEFQEERLTRQLGALQVVYQTRPTEYEATLTRFLAQADAIYAVFALEHSYARLEPDALGRVIGSTRSRFPHLTEVWLKAFEEQRRKDHIGARRAVAHSADHRFFLGLLVNAPDRQAILRMVRERVPQQDPIETLLGWVKELSELPVKGPLGPTALGAQLDEASHLVLRALLSGRSVGGVLETLKVVFAEADVDAQREEILHLISAFRESLFFRALIPPLT